MSKAKPKKQIPADDLQYDPEWQADWSVLKGNLKFRTIVAVVYNVLWCRYVACAVCTTA
jgi:hypothetical protein